MKINKIKRYVAENVFNCKTLDEDLQWVSESLESPSHREVRGLLPVGRTLQRCYYLYGHSERCGWYFSNLYWSGGNGGTVHCDDESFMGLYYFEIDSVNEKTQKWFEDGCKPLHIALFKKLELR